MSKSTLFTLYRVREDGSTEAVSEHPDFGSGWSAGQHAVSQDKQGAYSLFQGNRRLAKFGHSRLQAKATSFEWTVLG